jgi:hypothetical protein
VALWLYAFHGFKPNQRISSPNREMIVGGHAVRRGDIPEYLNDPQSTAALEVWTRWRLLGDPFGNGWANWPAHIVDIIETLEGEYRKIQDAKEKQKK